MSPIVVGLIASLAVDPAETQDQSSLGIVRHQLSAPFPWTVVIGSDWWRPVRSKYRYAMTYQDFFQTVGRTDLAASYGRRYVTSQVLIYGGALVELAGVFLLFKQLATSGFDTTAKIGLGMFAGGLVATGVGGVLQFPPVGEDEAIEMAARHNATRR